MSSGQTDALAVDSDLAKLAPRFAAAVREALAACNDAGLDAKVYEGYRSQALQALYYARGRTVIPPSAPVTNAQSNLYSWHGYGLAVDVISKSAAWNKPESWFADVAAIFKRFGCNWGGDWKQRDLPHFQWGRCRPSPSDLAREIVAAQGAAGVWLAVGATDGTTPPPAPASTTAAPAAGAAASGVAAPHVQPSTPAPVPSEIGRLQLNENTQNGALILKARFPAIIFTSGRRAIGDQARAMASDVVKDRGFIAATYKPSPLCTACQRWVDQNPQVTDEAGIALGITSVFHAVPESELMQFSKHLTGDAFDVAPVNDNASAIKSFIQRLPLIEKFLDHEGNLVRWHAQFYR